MDHRLVYGPAADSPNRWTLDTSDMSILACIKVASAKPVNVVIHVRSPKTRSRERGEFAIACVSTHGDTWRVEHGFYEIGSDRQLPAMSLVLAGAPESIGLQLAKL